MLKVRRLYAPGDTDPTFTVLARRDKSKTESEYPLCKADAETIRALKSVKRSLPPSKKGRFLARKEMFFDILEPSST